MFVNRAKIKLWQRKRTQLHIRLIEAGGTCGARLRAIDVNLNAVSAFLNPCEEDANPRCAY